jgi:lipopolysaccharide assembly outer membrane protein LptD (OstA)
LYIFGGKIMKKVLRIVVLMAIGIFLTVLLTAQTTTTSQTTSQKKAKTIRISTDYVEQKGDQIYYKGKVFANIEEEKTTIKTSEMYVKKVGDKWQVVEVPVKADFSFDGGTAVADKMTYDIEQRTGTLINSVVNMVDSKSKENITIVSDTLDFNLESDVYTGTKKGGVNITKGSIFVVADRFEYYKKSGELRLFGSVVINDNKNKIKMTASDAIVYTEKNEVKANNVNIEMTVE